ncbi:MAG: hypothetical protein A2X86_00550 [Bdellovibrionales bacterium GWA2_49_15]|nr:MAG: hypothetical protein A2X86_00550 [Bdellovibrionales bacterium GWA2_49_15]HAZ13245.1 hypothetical protein [Bdellovibrionales bacterium]
MGACKDIIAKLRERLLDLSGRNSMISFRHSARSKRYVRVIDEVPAVILKKLEDGKKLRIAPLPRPNTDPVDEKTTLFQSRLDLAKTTDEQYLHDLKKLGDAPSPKAEERIEAELRDRLRVVLGLPPITRNEAPDPIAAAKLLGINPDYELLEYHEDLSSKHTDDILQTLNFPQELERRLRTIYEQSHLTESETGVSTLHLAIGFLEWYESKDSEKSIFSPLLLFPAQVERQIEDGTYVYTVEAREEEVVPNRCLRERLKQDFELFLPFPDDDEGFDSYLAKVTDVIKDEPHWKVHRFVTLGFFAFSKLVMHEDLADPTWNFESESLVSKLFEGKESGTAMFAEDYYPDEPEFSSKIPLLALDADSSQVSALIDVMSGKNLVIEGPPGTGKSQTIANIIAAAMSQGKTVLFVAEKTAALEAVKRYLDHAELGIFCLELHSRKARRTDVLKSIKDTMKLKGSHYLDSKIDALVKRQDEIRSEIGRYLTGLHSKHGNLGHNCRDLIWFYSRISADNQEIFEKIHGIKIAKVSEISLERHDGIVVDLAQLGKMRAELSSNYAKLSEHPWFGLAHDSLNPLTEKTLIQGTRILLTHVSDFLNALDSMELFRHASKNRTPDEICDTLQKIVKISPPPLKVFTLCRQALISADSRTTLEQYITSKEAVAKTRITLSHLFESNDISPCTNLDLLSSLANEVSGNYVHAKTFEELHASIQPLKTTLEVLNRAKGFCEVLAKVGLNVVSIDQLLDTINLINAVQDGADAYFKYRNLPNLTIHSEEILKAAQEQVNTLRELQDTLGGTFRLDQDDNPVIVRETAQVFRRAGFWRFLNSEYRRAQLLVKEISCISLSANRDEIAHWLDAYASFLELKHQFQTSVNLKSLCGRTFQGINTPIKDILKCLSVINAINTQRALSEEWCETVKKWFAQLPEEIFNQLNHFKSGLPQLVEHLCKFNVRTNNLEGIYQAGQLAISKSEKILKLGKECQIKLTTSFAQLSISRELFKELKSNEELLSNLRNTNEIIKKIEETSQTQLIDLRSCLDYESLITVASFSEDTRTKLLSDEGLSHFNRIHSLCCEQLGIMSELEKEIDDFVTNSTRGGLIKRLGCATVASIDLLQLQKMLQDALASTNLLASFYSYLNCHCKQLKCSETSELMEKWEKHGYSFVDLPLAFQALMIRELLDGALSKFPEISNKVGSHLTGLRDEFKKNDTTLLAEYRKMLRKKLLSTKIPPGISKGKKAKDLTELGLIDREIAKKTKHVPIRELMHRAIAAVRAIKPCFMMSPLSVANFLPAHISKFDLIIMDEASQLRTEDVIGSLLRSRQAVIVGDPHQLPPTSFFDFFADDEDVEEEQDVSLDCESVLDLAIKNYRPARRLKWHYRSRHQSLIAYSNHAFYNRELVIFPSSFDIHPDLGFEYVPCKGVYDKRRNLIEANKVVRAVSQHMMNYPERSLGVVTMNGEQKELVRDLFESELKSDPVMQAFLAKWDASEKREPFFIKNLENVQGDERDVILVSTVFGNDPNGNFYQRFGPINRPTGHRRLNVLFTRAKCKVSIFSSIDPEQIVVENQSSQGVRTFRGFLEYAKTGLLPELVTTTGGGTDSPFEDFVLSALKGHGYDVVTQVGVAGYFIDLAVRDPKMPGRFVLGIECDGRTYHSAKCARDRDRLRQENLERLNWHIYRIWSTDWFRDPKSETEKLIRKIESRLAQSDILTAPKLPVKPTQQELPKQNKTLEIPKEPPHITVASVPPQPCSIQPIKNSQTITAELCLNIFEWNKKANRMTNSYEISLLRKLENALYFLSRGREVNKELLADAQKAVSRAISLGYDSLKKYS